MMKKGGPRPNTAFKKLSKLEEMKLRAEEERKKKELEELWKKFTVNYKETSLLSEGQSMIIIERSSDCDRYSMSTRHDEAKYVRIADKMRDNILRDFPSVKVIIKPNRHEDSLERLGCFEIVYFQKKDGEIKRETIFSKLVFRRWPKWVNIEATIKQKVSNSNVVIRVSIDESNESGKQNFSNVKLDGATIKIMSIVFKSDKKKKRGLSGRSTRLRSGGLSLSARPNTTIPRARSRSRSIGRRNITPKLVPFQTQVTDSDGVVAFEHVPLGNYAVVFEGDRTFKASSFQFNIDGHESDIIKDMPLEVVNEGFLCVRINMEDFRTMQERILNDIGENVKNPAKKKEFEVELEKWKAHMKKVSNYYVNVTMIADDEDEEDISIPTELVRNDRGIESYFNGIFEPDTYAVWFTNGKERHQVTKMRIRRGENLIEYNPYKKEASNVDEAKVESDTNREVEQKEAGKVRPVTGHHSRQALEHSAKNSSRNSKTSKVSNSSRHEERNRVPSSPSSPSEKSQKRSGRIFEEEEEVEEPAPVQQEHSSPTLEPVQEEPIKARQEPSNPMTVRLVGREPGELPLYVTCLYEDTQDEVIEVGKTIESMDNVKTLNEDGANDIAVTDLGGLKNGFMRIKITKRNEGVPFDGEIKLQIFKESEQIYEEALTNSMWQDKENYAYDAGVIKIPEVIFIPLGVLTTTLFKPMEKLYQIKKLANFCKQSNTQFTIENIFGFDKQGISEDSTGDKVLKKSEVMDSLENYTLDDCEYIVDSFKSNPALRKISLNVLKSKMEIWTNNIELFKHIEDENGNDSGDKYEDGFEDMNYNDEEF